MCSSSSFILSSTIVSSLASPTASMITATTTPTTLMHTPATLIYGSLDPVLFLSVLFIFPSILSRLECLCLLSLYFYLMLLKHLFRKLYSLDVVSANENLITLRKYTGGWSNCYTPSQFEIHKRITSSKLAIIRFSIFAVDHHLWRYSALFEDLQR